MSKINKFGIHKFELNKKIYYTINNFDYKMWFDKSDNLIAKESLGQKFKYLTTYQYSGCIIFIIKNGPAIPIPVEYVDSTDKIGKYSNWLEKVCGIKNFALKIMNAENSTKMVLASTCGTQLKERDSMINIIKKVYKAYSWFSNTPKTIKTNDEFMQFLNEKTLELKECFRTNKPFNNFNIKDESNKVEVTPLSKTSEIIQNMKLWAKGQRGLNIKACSNEKLLAYYLICKENKFINQQKLLEQELIARNIKYPSDKSNSNNSNLIVVKDTDEFHEALTKLYKKDYTTLKSIDMQYFDTSNMTDMYEMFDWSNLKEIKNLNKLSMKSIPSLLEIQSMFTTPSEGNTIDLSKLQLDNRIEKQLINHQKKLLKSIEGYKKNWKKMEHYAELDQEGERQACCDDVTFSSNDILEELGASPFHVTNYEEIKNCNFIATNKVLKNEIKIIQELVKLPDYDIFFDKW